MRYSLLIPILACLASCELFPNSESDDTLDSASSSSVLVSSSGALSSSSELTSSSSAIPMVSGELRPLLAAPPAGPYFTIRFFGAQINEPYGEIDTTLYAQGAGYINADWGDSSGFAGLVLIRDSVTYSKVTSVRRFLSQTAFVNLEVGEPLLKPYNYSESCRYVTGKSIKSIDNGYSFEPELDGYVTVRFFNSTVTQSSIMTSSGAYYTNCLADSVFQIDPHWQSRTTFIDSLNHGAYYKDLLTCQNYLVGAPNIYLYPKQTTQVHAQLESPSHDSILVTLPEYGNGWNVSVSPDGTIDGKYPFLYYEGASAPSAKSDSGWVLDGSKLSTEFQRILAGEGFQGREVTDFLEFWLPRLPQRPYWLLIPEPINKHFILSITPTPNELHRVLWTIRPLNAPIDIPAPQQHPVRRDAGFVAVEWGMIVDPALLAIPAP